MNNNMVYGPLALPSGKKIKFRAPKGIDRINILQMTKIDSENVVSGALLLDEYVKAKCITEIDGIACEGDYKKTMNEWLDSDITFYKLVYEEMFGKSQDMQDKAKEAAAFLLQGLTSFGGCSVLSTQGSAIQNG